MNSGSSGSNVWSRRRVLQQTLGGVAGLATWHGWPSLQRALAQKGTPTGQMTWALHITLAPTWFDPAETGALITPYLCLYALHDALVKPMPDGRMSPCLATAWRESADGLTYDFELRQGVKFHNGDPFTAEDVQFTFARYKGAGAAELKKQVKTIEIVNPHHIRFVLHEPWPDFLTFYATPATGAAWIVPKNYTEKTGSDAFKTQPVGLGPYRFVEYKPGLELILEAHTDYWRKTPVVKRLVFKSVPEPTTRLAMLKRQEADVTYALYSTLGEEVRRDKTLKLEPTLAGTEWGIFVDMYDPQSPWHDKRVRLAANHAVNRQAINEAETLGYSKLLGGIIPQDYEFALKLEPYAYDPKKAKALLAEAGYPNGFDAGEFSCDAVYAGVIEGVVNDLGAVGIQAKVQPRERAAMQGAQREKKVKNLTRMGSGAVGNAATRIESFMVSTGVQSFLKDPEIDQWFAQQSRARDRATRETLLHKIQQKVYDEAYFLPIWQLGFLCATGPRVAVSGLGLIPGHIYSAPYEEVRLKA
ncbi:MAG: ABC transporter substrate-binding protein [Candidatus Tectimicrobiota bacterium]